MGDDSIRTYENICSALGYKYGLVEKLDQSRSPIQKYLFSEAKRLIKDFNSIYFKGDEPIIYFKLLSDYDEGEIIRIHRCIWNQNRVPFLYIITPGELRIYNCFELPVNPESNDKLDSEPRLIDHIKIAVNLLEQLKDLSNIEINTGEIWKSITGKKFHSDKRVDVKLLENLRITRKKLHQAGLNYSIIHNLLGRSIFILYLEDRHAIDENYYRQYLGDAKTYFDVISNKDALYSLFEHLQTKFNGDLFPVTEEEKRSVNGTHLHSIHELFHGTDMITGQTTLWRPYDFGIIPIEFISAIYEEFLHAEDGQDATSVDGVYYTPHNLVEFILNEILPWPSPKDHKYDLKILDPACGSGVFLVDSYRRLIERWIYTHNKKISPEELKKILVTTIFGIDKNPDAIKVATFSLYLALMDYLEPKTIWYEIKFPYLIYDINKKNRSNNLFPLDTFDSGPFEKNNFDIIVGNPPWKRDNLPKKISDYCHEHGFAQEIAQAFLWRVRDFTTNGRIALVGTSKILFNIEEPDKHFRHLFFKENYVEMIVNFSALRRKKAGTGKQLFFTSLGPAAIFLYRVMPPEKQKPTILYCTPKPTVRDSKIPNIFIDASDIKFLPREKCSSDIIWKAAMWGNQRDFDLIEHFNDSSKLSSIIKSCNESSPWKIARGFQTSSKPALNKINEKISKLKFIDAKNITRYWINPSKFISVNSKTKTFAWFGCYETYIGPHIIIKMGQCNRKFCAAFAESDFAFRDVVLGIKGPISEIDLMKTITAYLNSSFAFYYLFMTASTWGGIERDKILLSEILSLPDIPFQLKNSETKKIAMYVDKISNLLATNSGNQNDSRIFEIEKKIDNIIYSKLELSSSDRFLINDILNYSIDFFQFGERSNACTSVNQNDLEEYAKIYCDTINSILKFGGEKATAKIYSGNSPLSLVSIIFNSDRINDEIQIIDSGLELEQALSKLDKFTIDKHSDSVYFRRNIKIYYDHTLNIIKPNEKRFWTKSIALRDADETLAEGIRKEG
jgi:type I restriction-modification system DNA methylase subunit